LDACHLHWYNADMRKFWVFSIWIFFLVGSLVSACTQEGPFLTPSTTGTLAGTLRPYPTDTLTSTPLPTGYATPTPSPTLTATATQIFYEVQENDDMFGIGLRYDVTVQAIMTANPSVNPYAMGPGTTLLIPLTPSPGDFPTSNLELTPTPTPENVRMADPDCYPDALGGLMCFVLVENNQEVSLENISGVIILGDGETVRQETANTLLNLLPARASLPLVASFQPPIPPDVTVTAQVTFYLPVMPGDNRYLPLEIVDQTISLSKEGRTANLSGELRLPEDQPGAAYVWVHATAFNAAGEVVGVRRWQLDSPISSGSLVPFELTVYSMSGAIDHVDLLIEARRE